MRKVKQRHHNGCAIASLAMLTGISYNKSLKLIHPKRKKNDSLFGCELEDVLRALDKLKVKHRVSFSKSDLFKPKKAMIAVLYNYTDKNKARHAVVWINKKIIDPIEKTPYKELTVTKNYIKKRFSFIIEILS
jgi:ABC-type bacteriocin/lantibiotic exporter with double-glycine peptidase domain